MKKERVFFSQRRYDTGMKLMDVGNFAAAGLTFGQAVSDRPFSFEVAGLGLLLLLWAYSVGWILMKGGGKT